MLRAGPAEFAAALPELLGFPPVESLVLLFLGGGDRPDRRMSLTLRLDLLAAEHDAEVARQVVARAEALRPWGALVFVVSEDPDSRSLSSSPIRGGTPRLAPTSWTAHRPDLPRRPLVHAVIEELSALGTQTVDAVLVRAGRRVTLRRRHVHRRRTRHPLDPDASRLTGIAALRGEVVDPDRDTVVARAWPTRPTSADFAHVCRRADATLDVRIARGASLGELIDEGWGVVRRAVAACVPGNRGAHRPGVRPGGGCAHPGPGA